MNDETLVASHEHQPLTAHQLVRLHADLHPSRVASREGAGGRNLSYLEAYDVRATLIRIFGYGGFSLECVNYRVVHESVYQSRESGRDLWRVGIIATMRLTIHQTGAVYTESAASSQSGPDVGEVFDFALKTAQSDALKRCATNLGTTFGLSLYRDGSLRDVVARVFAPGQMDVVEDLRVAQLGGDESTAARTRLQDRLKTSTPPADVDEPTTPEPAETEPVGEAAPVVEPVVEPEPVAPAPRARARRTPPRRTAPAPADADKPDPLAQAREFAAAAQATKAAQAAQASA